MRQAEIHDIIRLATIKLIKGISRKPGGGTMVRIQVVSPKASMT